MLIRSGPTWPPAPAMAWHFRQTMSVRRNTFSPRAGSPDSRTSATICFISASLSWRGRGAEVAGLRQRLDQGRRLAAPELRTMRTPTLATSAGSFLPASAFARLGGPVLALEEGVEDLGRSAPSS